MKVICLMLLGLIALSVPTGFVQAAAAQSRSINPAAVTRELVPSETNGLAGADHHLVGFVFHLPDEVAEVQLQKRVRGANGKGKAWIFVRTADVVDNTYSLKFTPELGRNRYRVKAIIRKQPEFLDDPLNEVGLPPLIDTPESTVKYSRPFTVKARQPSEISLAASESVKKWIVGLGDSYLSGEGATFAQFNTTSTSFFAVNPDWWIEAYGSSLKETYPNDYDYPVKIPLYGTRCHRSASAAMHWGRAGYAGMNLACSGATQGTQSKVGKPGVDFYPEGHESEEEAAHLKGQAAQLEDFARLVTEQGDVIDTIILSIGGNDIYFSGIISECAKLAILGKSCSNESTSTLRKQMSNGLNPVKEAVVNSLNNIVRAMDQAGIARQTYRINVQAYPIGMPKSDDLADYLNRSLQPILNRQKFGGCPFTNADLDYINSTFSSNLRDRVIEGAREVLKATIADGKRVNISVVDVGDSFDKHQLCSKFVKVDDRTSKDSGKNTLIPPWTGFAGGVDGQWISPIIMSCIQEGAPCLLPRALPWKAYPTFWTAVDHPSGCPDYSGTLNWDGQLEDAACAQALENMRQTPIHPNYWGQRQLSACHDLIASDPKSPGQVLGCHATEGLDDYGRPNVRTSQDGYL